VPRIQAVEKWRRDRPTQTVFLGGLPRYTEENDVRFLCFLSFLLIMLQTSGNINFKKFALISLLLMMQLYAMYTTAFLQEYNI